MVYTTLTSDTWRKLDVFFLVWARKGEPKKWKLLLTVTKRNLIIQLYMLFELDLECHNMIRE